MQVIPIRAAKEGMELAKGAVTEDGKVLCGEGTTLTMAVISRLEKSGVGAITVKGHPVRLPGEKGLKERIKDLEERFLKVKDDPVERALMRLIAEYWVESYSA